MDQPEQWRHMSTAPKDGTRILVTVRPVEQGPADVDVAYWAATMLGRLVAVAPGATKTPRRKERRTTGAGPRVADRRVGFMVACMGSSG